MQRRPSHSPRLTAPSGQPHASGSAVVCLREVRDFVGRTTNSSSTMVLLCRLTTPSPVAAARNGHHMANHFRTSGGTGVVDVVRYAIMVRNTPWPRSHTTAVIWCEANTTLAQQLHHDSDHSLLVVISAVLEVAYQFIESRWHTAYCCRLCRRGSLSGCHSFLSSVALGSVPRPTKRCELFLGEC